MKNKWRRKYFNPLAKYELVMLVVSAELEQFEHKFGWRPSFSTKGNIIILEPDDHAANPFVVAWRPKDFLGLEDDRIAATIVKIMKQIDKHTGDQNPNIDTYFRSFGPKPPTIIERGIREKFNRIRKILLVHPY